MSGAPNDLINHILLGGGCDNTATIVMLEEPGWRTACISMCREAPRQEMPQIAFASLSFCSHKQTILIV